MITRLQSSRAAQVLRQHGFVLALLAVFVYLTARHTGLYPMVFADEWSYSSNARLLPFSESIVPSWLYFGLFRATNQCGAGFLDCARMLNVLVYLLSAPLVWLIARRVCSPRMALWIAVMAVLAPVNSYTAYFMPEPMYFTGFCLFAWATLALRDWPPLAYGALTGAILGLMSLVKVHGLFLLPVLLAFIGWDCIRRPGGLVRGLLQMGAAIAAMLAIRFGLGYLLAGKVALMPFGSFYTGHVNSKTSSLDRVLVLIPGALVNLKGHAMAIMLLLGLPAATLVLHAADRATRAKASAELRALQALALIALAVTLGVTVMYTASVESYGPGELTRLHVRYYSFVFPLLFAAAAASAFHCAEAASLLKRMLVALPLAALVLVSGLFLVPAYAVGITDAPELAPLVRKQGFLLGLALLSAALLMAWAWRPRLGARLFVYGLLPLTLLTSAAGITAMMRGARDANHWDRAALTAVHYLGKQEAARLVVAGDSVGGLMRALFHIDSAGASMRQLAPGAPLLASELTPGTSWLLVIGQHALPPGTVPHLKTADFALVKGPVAGRSIGSVDMSAPLKSGVLSKVEGMWEPEPWGSWSVGKTITLHFARPLPKSMGVLIHGNAYYTNLHQDFFMTVGGQRQPFQMAHERQDRYLQFSTDGNTRTLTIEIPKPTAPADDGNSSDTRLLGLALTRIDITELP